MIKIVLLTAVIAVAFAAPAFANHCPKDMAAIDAALAKNPKLSAEQMAASPTAKRCTRLATMPSLWSRYAGRKRPSVLSA